jgi:hypothetical protein
LPIEASLPQIWVERDGDAERARKLIQALLAPGPSGPPRDCPHCGEENPGTFETCWNCGRSLD